MPKGEKDDSGAENEKKNNWKLIKLLWICFFFWMTDFLSGNFSLFSQVSAKKFRISQLFCMHLFSQNSCSSVFRIQYCKRVSTGNHYVLIFITCPWTAWDCLSSSWFHSPVPYSAWAQTPWQNLAELLLIIGRNTALCRDTFSHPVHGSGLHIWWAYTSHHAWTSKSIAVFKSHETWPIEITSIFLHLGNLGKTLPATKN